MLSRTFLVVVLAAVVAAPSLAGAKQSKAEREAALIAVLKSKNATLKARWDACRELARIGTARCIPALVPMLPDQKLNHMARYALEPIPDPAVDEALRSALGRCKGRALAGVITSLGVRRDPKAAGPIAKFLASTDPDVAQAAARALGSIATDEALAALERALPKATGVQRLAVCEGLLRCAEALAAKGSKQKAQAIYDKLRAIPNPPHQVRTAALRGSVLMRGDAGIPLLLEAIRGKDFVLVEAAARTAMEMPGSAVTKALAAELPNLPTDKQILLTQTLGWRHDPAAVPALVALARKGATPARVAAIRALPEIPSPEAVPALAELLTDRDQQVADAARRALAGLEGKEVNAAILAMLKDPKAARRTLAVELIASRRIVSAIPDLTGVARDDKDEGVRCAAISALGAMVGEAEFPRVVDLLVGAKSQAEVRAAERALLAVIQRVARPAPGRVVIRKAIYGDLPRGKRADVTRRVARLVKAGRLSFDATNSTLGGDPAHGIVKKLYLEYTLDGVLRTLTVGEGQTVTLSGAVVPRACSEALCGAFPRAPAQAKVALLRVLRAVHDDRALATVRSALADRNPQVANAALSTLCDWPTSAALPTLMDLARKGKDARTKVLALRGAIRLIPLQAAPADRKLASLKEALSLATRPEEKRQALSALAQMPSAAALSLALSLLGDQGLKEEACAAAVAVAEKLLPGSRAAVADAMDRVAKATANKSLAKRAAALARQARAGRPRK